LVAIALQQETETTFYKTTRIAMECESPVLLFLSKEQLHDDATDDAKMSAHKNEICDASR
jgi:hypothetical protein